ncbi:hypothetical protein CDAR_391151 [Caerostris darwini]|uniref:RNase H type-1 domain-containing protein n=1 Tax=Caerostris darwini TaxID=1538125 RepID=A0AAV4UAU4_9ARAC|nr:hypothetical protein CDAR_391151 [Caerostris darwini]
MLRDASTDVLRQQQASSPHTSASPKHAQNLYGQTPNQKNLEGTLDLTDGSKLNDRVSGAFVIFSEGKEVFSRRFRLSDHATVYLAEQTAIHLAIDHNLQLASIVTDSRSVLQALQNINPQELNILKCSQSKNYMTLFICSDHSPRCFRVRKRQMNMQK